MKKFTLCAIVVTGLLVAVPPVLQLIDAAQADDGAQPDVVDEVAADTAVQESEAPSADGEDVEKPDLRAEYLRLAEEHARLMNDEELTKAIAALRQTITQLPAKRELEAVLRQLEEIIEKHPDGEAAERAAAAKSALEGDSDGAFFGGGGGGFGGGGGGGGFGGGGGGFY